MSVPDVLQALSAAATQDVVAAGLHWRVGRVTTADLIEAGGSMLLIAQRAKEAPPEAGGVASVDPAEVVKGYRFYDQLVAAGLRAVSKDGVSWTAVRVVLDAAKEDLGQGRMALGTLPPGVASQLGTTIMELSTDGGAAGDRLASFLGGGAPAPARARK